MYLQTNEAHKTCQNQMVITSLKEVCQNQGIRGNTVNHHRSVQGTYMRMMMNEVDEEGRRLSQTEWLSF
ncbi:hypothetical protein [Scopulibacillus cellulosilyticus]|uniref:Uncharacterized protein n=1 Tax=Scopulibacillus cellulosilyticus TaxID=2665665 RepID=A0ABW2PZB1_9BACL